MAICGEEKRVPIVGDAVAGFMQGFCSPPTGILTRGLAAIDPRQNASELSASFNSTATHLMQQKQAYCRSARTQFSFVEDGAATVFVKFNGLPMQKTIDGDARGRAIRKGPITPSDLASANPAGNHCEVAFLDFSTMKSDEVLCTYFGFYLEAFMAAQRFSW